MSSTRACRTLSGCRDRYLSPDRLSLSADASPHRILPPDTIALSPRVVAFQPAPSLAVVCPLPVTASPPL